MLTDDILLNFNGGKRMRLMDGTHRLFPPVVRTDNVNIVGFLVCARLSHNAEVCGSRWLTTAGAICNRFNIAAEERWFCCVYCVNLHGL